MILSLMHVLDKINNKDKSLVLEEAVQELDVQSFTNLLPNQLVEIIQAVKNLKNLTSLHLFGSDKRN